MCDQSNEDFCSLVCFDESVDIVEGFTSSAMAPSKSPYSHLSKFSIGLLVCLLAILASPSLLHGLLNAGIRASSTPKDPSVGDVRPPSTSQLRESLYGKHALVVGGTRGIGRGIASSLVRHGVASVTVVGRNTRTIVQELEAIQSNASPPNQQPTSIRAYSVDLSTTFGAR